MTRKVRIDRRQTKKDTGVAIVPAPMSTGEIKSFPLREEIRDILNKRPHPSDSKPTINIQIPVDSSRMTTQELEAGNYSGYRVNHLKGTFEIWVLGRVAVSERASRVQKNPGIIADMHERAFSTTGSVVDVDVVAPNQSPILVPKKT